MVYIIAVYEGRKYSGIEISETNTVKEIMDICYNKIEKLNKPENERFYSKEKILVKFNWMIKIYYIFHLIRVLSFDNYYYIFYYIYSINELILN